MTPPNNQNKSQPWHDKLNSLEAAPDAGAWQVLSDRMTTSRPNKTVYWYWMTAAVTIGCAFLSIIIFEKKTENPPVVQSKTSAKIVFPNHQIVQEPIVKAPSTVTVRKGGSLKRKSIHLAVAPTQQLFDSIAVVQQTITARVLPFEHPAPALPVIHINDLNKRASQTDMFAQNNEELKHARRMTLSDNSSENIIKINLTPTN